jgi:hypothetical protein
VRKDERNVSRLLQAPTLPDLARDPGVVQYLGRLVESVRAPG